MKLVFFFAHFDELLLKSFNQTRYVFLSSWIVRNYLQNLVYVQFVNLLAGPKNRLRTIKTYAVKFTVRFNLVTQLQISNKPRFSHIIKIVSPVFIYNYVILMIEVSFTRKKVLVKP